MKIFQIFLLFRIEIGSKTSKLYIVNHKPQEVVMIVRVDSNITNAIDEYLASVQGDYQDVARSVGVSPASITKWRKIGNGITDAKWKKLFPIIRPFLPKDRIYIDDAGCEQYSSTISGTPTYTFEPKYIPTMIPNIPFDMLSEYDNMLESMVQYGKRINATEIEYRPKHSDVTGIWATSINDKKYAPALPKDAMLYICTSETPRSNRMVIVKTHNNDVFVARYQLMNGKFALLDIVADKPIICEKIADVRKIIQWIFPVLYYEVVTF